VPSNRSLQAEALDRFEGLFATIPNFYERKLLPEKTTSAEK
jgi:hypothetical protein